MQGGLIYNSTVFVEGLALQQTIKNSHCAPCRNRNSRAFGSLHAKLTRGKKSENERLGNSEKIQLFLQLSFP